MDINQTVLDRIRRHGSQFVAVTKYFSATETAEILAELKTEKCFYGCGENRVKSLAQKKISRKYCHFIGNIQSRDIPDIVEHCSVVHSLDSLKHARKFAAHPKPPEMFLQINISNESQKSGIFVQDLPGFLAELPPNLVVLGLSAIGLREFTVAEKSAEFLALKALRDQYNLDWKISAGTSRDYEIALESEIEVVRVGKGLFS